jgi:hypothetical protein
LLSLASPLVRGMSFRGLSAFYPQADFEPGRPLAILPAAFWGLKSGCSLAHFLA